jgi:DNA-binding response OmpR family regulator
MERERESPLVLVADDDLLLRHMARDALEQAGFAVEEAGNGLEAISAFQRLQPDVVLLDVMMPELDGFSACAHIRHLPGGDLTPILIVTGLDDLESIRRAYEVGATDFLAKPVNWGVLGHHVQYMLRASRAFSKLRQSEAKNQALLNAIPDLMFRISGDGIFLEAKESKGTGFYVDSRGVPGRSLNEVLPKDVAEKMAYHIQKAFRTNEVAFVNWCNFQSP